MGDYQEGYLEEMGYLEKVLLFLKKALEKETYIMSERKSKLKTAMRDMYEDTAHFTQDFERLTEVNQHLEDINNQTATYGRSKKLIEKYGRILKAPYFGRFDLKEEGYTGTEKIYIGLANVMDPKSQDILIYDWRAPISSIFYRFELGKAVYQAPIGEIAGEVMLKRQYQIHNSQLKGFFDCNIAINDEILQEVLSQHSSPKMRNIVETIQKEQDAIIRDSENELLIVQGVAGSGKTSVALHRIAYLLYLGMNLQLASKNIMIISPNAAFSRYISNVLPELGEENVVQMTFEELVSKCIRAGWKMEGRQQQLEYLICNRAGREAEIRRQSVAFKGSNHFTKILNRLLSHFERQMIPFEDIYFHGRILETKQGLKRAFLHNKIGMPAVKRLERMESILIEKVRPLQKERLLVIEKIVQKMGNHELNIKSYSRLLSMKEARNFAQRIRQFTQADFFELYQNLFTNEDLFYKLSKGLPLPKDIKGILAKTGEDLRQRNILQEDCAPLLYLKLKLEGGDYFPEIQQVFIDEAQDYTPLQYEIYKILFKDARYTVLGDVNQTMEKEVETPYHQWVPEVLRKKKTIKLFLNKGYRSSYEINHFNQKLLGEIQEYRSFERYEEEPRLVPMNSTEEIDAAILRDVGAHMAQGYESLAIISKTMKEAEEIYERLSPLIRLSLIRDADADIKKGILVIPAYMAKGLEFDTVMIYNAGKSNFDTEYDRKLLYVACTRALHRLTLYYTGEKFEDVCTEERNLLHKDAAADTK